MLKDAMGSVLDLFYPKNCHVCSTILRGRTGAFDDHLCWDCFSAMRPAPPVYPNNAQANGLPYHRLCACYRYEGAARDLICKFKYGQRPYLSDTVVRLMMRLVNPDFFQDVDCLVPVPLHPARAREREFNQSELLAKALSPLLRKPVSGVLKKIKNTKSQTALEKARRFANVAGTFALTDLSVVRDKHILVIDDVITTTATVSEAARRLKDAGARRVSVLAFARG
jgi:competence protein ComFC